jgi:uncharacterized membrane protein YfcA
VLAGLQGLWVVRSEIMANPIRLLLFLVPGLAGIPLGLILLELIDAGTLRIGIAILLIIYGGYFSLRAALPAFERRTPWLDAAIGFVGGVLGGAASVSGALPAMWLSIRPWPKAETRAVLQPYNVVILSTTFVLLALKGTFDNQALSALVVTIPAGIVAAQVGIFVFKRLTNDGFRRLLIVLTFLMGMGILVSEIV